MSLVEDSTVSRDVNTVSVVIEDLTVSRGVGSVFVVVDDSIGS